MVEQIIFNFTQTPLTCEAGFKEYLSTSATNLNYGCVILFLLYVGLMTFLQYHLERGELSTESYILLHHKFNNLFFLLAIILGLYAWLLA